MPQTLGVTRLAAAGALAVFLVGLGYAIVSGLGDDEGAPAVVAPAPVTTSTTTKPAAGRPKAAPFVKLSAAGAFDPEGDGRERDEEAQLAVDGRQETFWRTERYARFFKSGVGLVLDAGPARPGRAGGRRQRRPRASERRSGSARHARGRS